MKSMALLLCISFFCMNGMDTNVLQKKSTNSWSMIYKGQKINVLQQSLAEVINELGDNIKDNKTHTKYPYHLTDPLWQQYQQQSPQKMSCFIIHYYNDPSFFTHFYQNSPIHSYPICSSFHHHGNTVTIKTANHILETQYHFIQQQECLTARKVKTSSVQLKDEYKKILYKNLKNSTRNSLQKNLPYHSLNIDFRYPDTKLVLSGIKFILKLISKESDLYGTINFFVNSPVDFAWYKTVLFEQTGLLHRICLFYWMHKNHDNLSQLPQEIRDYIVKLIMFN